MSAAQFARIKEILSGLRDLDRHECPVYLDRACAGDPDQRAEVESLMAHGERTAVLPERATFATRSAEALLAALESADTPPLPEVIGKYRILRRVATGGMGVVYKAQQDQPRRTVALKLIRRARMTPGLTRRFRREAEILGRLRHPWIAQIHDAGTFDLADGPLPFMVMEFVDGVPATNYVRARKLTPRQRLELFVKVCDAVEHAHRQGVVHRDLKPDNIFVQADGTPKVLDFGVARATGFDLTVTTLQTDLGQLIGTVPYMSPEQVAGNALHVDARSDVYALGVVLFELLGGRLPYDLSRRSIPEAARIIQEQEPMRLASVNAMFRGDVDTIVSRAMAKEPDERYPSVAAMAADIRRHLADEPILARRASAFYRLRKCIKRHKVMAAGLGIGFTVMSIATALSLWHLHAVRAAPVADRPAGKAETGAQATHVAIAPDGQRVAVATRHGLSIWDSAGEQILCQADLFSDRTHAVRYIAFSPDSREVVVSLKAGEHEDVVLIDARTGQRLSPDERALPRSQSQRPEPQRMRGELRNATPTG